MGNIERNMLDSVCENDEPVGKITDIRIRKLPNGSHGMALLFDTKDSFQNPVLYELNPATAQQLEAVLRLTKEKL